VLVHERAPTTSRSEWAAVTGMRPPLQPCESPAGESNLPRGRAEKSQEVAWKATEGIRREKKDKKENKKLTSGSYLSFTYPTFNVSKPNRKRVGPISTQPNRKWSHPVPQIRDGIITPHLDS
jgi:hypothetical protein